MRLKIFKTSRIGILNGLKMKHKTAAAFLGKKKIHTHVILSCALLFSTCLKSVEVLANFAATAHAPLYSNTPNQTALPVQKFIDAVKTNDAQKIADFVSFPIKLDHPLPTIHDKHEFIENYDLLFDANSKRMITQSHANDWTQMGDKGIMFLTGLIWLNNDGKLIALNLKTPRQKQLATDIKKADLQTLHPTLKEFKRNLYKFKTSQGLGRIDELNANGQTSHKFRFSFWNQGHDFAGPPDTVLNGSKTFDGNGGNHYYEFKNDEDTYSFYVTLVGSDLAPPYELRVYKGNISRENDNLKASYIPTLLNQ